MRQKGISFIELIFTLAIIACIAIFAMQDHSALHKKNEVIVLKENLATALRYAKISAMTQGKAVYLVPLNPKNWADGIAMVTSKDKIQLYQWEWKYSAWEISWQGFHTENYLTVAANPQHSASNGRFILVHKISRETISLSVNRLGRIYT